MMVTEAETGSAKAAGSAKEREEDSGMESAVGSVRV